MAGHFICYSPTTSLDFALDLYNALKAGPPRYEVWLDKHDLKPGVDWDSQVPKAISECESLLFLMTPDSVEDQSVCKAEWTRALSSKRPVIPLLLDSAAELPFRLASRQYIDFTDDFEAGLARLRTHLKWLKSPEGVLHTLKERLTDAQRDLRRAAEGTPRAALTRDEIAVLEQQIAAQQRVVDNPEAEAKRVEESIARGLELERQPTLPVSGVERGKFINAPPAKAPDYFQNRHVETKLIGYFLEDEVQRLLTVVGRGGTGKTAMVCRLLRSLEGGQLPDDGGPLEVDGIVYLSANGSRRVTTPNLYADLCKLLPEETASRLDELYKNSRVSTTAKLDSLLAHFQRGRTVLLLDNFEDLIDPETFNIRDAELDEALRALLEGAQHTVKVILTTRLAPRELALLQPGRQTRIDLDDGLASPYAENILREMDADGKVGLRDAPATLLYEARQRTRGYPRALEALFAILSADRDTSLREILDDAAKMLPENVVKDLVGEAFDRLDPAARQVMQALAVYRHPVTTAAVDYLLQPYLPGVNSAPVLKRLVNMQFARGQSRRYFLHPVDRAYAFSRIPEGDPSDRDKEAPPYTQFALLHRAAEYFKQARLPREDWKTIEDLAPQLAEFDLRCEGEDYEAAAWVLSEIDYDYLMMWGSYLQVAEMHERLLGKISDQWMEARSLGNLGNAYHDTGQVQKAVTCYKRAMELYRKLDNQRDEGSMLGGVGNCYSYLGQMARAIEYYEQALGIARKTGDRRNEGAWLNNIGDCYSDLGQTELATFYYEQALAIAREMGSSLEMGAMLGNLSEVLTDGGDYARAIDRALEGVQIGGRLRSPFLGSRNNATLALAHLYAGDLTQARAAANNARQHNEPTHNHYVFSLLGLIALRQRDLPAAREAFTETVVHAELLLKYEANFRALYSKGLALCGLALCDHPRHTAAAVEAFKMARAINKDAGVVKRVVRLFDTLAEADAGGVLEGIRATAAGEE
jgi:tetratricopeptide (TPR) repeat protein